MIAEYTYYNKPAYRLVQYEQTETTLDSTLENVLENDQTDKFVSRKEFDDFKHQIASTINSLSDAYREEIDLLKHELMQAKSFPAPPKIVQPPTEFLQQTIQSL